MKTKPIIDPDFRRRWSLEHDHCMACGHDSKQWGRWLETHHIIGGWSRSDESTNLLRLCHRCHQLAEGLQVREGGVVLPVITLGMQLWLKRLRDPSEWNPDRLRELHGSALPELEPVPQLFIDEWN